MPIAEQERSGQTTPYQAAGELDGITKLVDEFYANMDTLPEAETIRKMHPPDLIESRKKLTYFLCGWLGGPRLFQEHYGPISIPGAHKRFPIGYEERDAWLLCMQRAIAVQPYSDQFKDYLLATLSIPAERVRQVNMGEF
jgi:hemoglobin